jgi:hypothetical protein
MAGDVCVSEVLENIAEKTGRADVRLVLPNNRLVGLGDEHLTLSDILDHPPPLEKRLAQDGHSYTRQQFLRYFGSERGERMWSVAALDELTASAASLLEASQAENANISEAVLRSRVEQIAVVHLCRYGGGHTEQFRDALLHGPALQKCRDALDAEGHSYVLPQGALMLVEPEMFQSAQNVVVEFELHPFHVIVCDDFKHLVDEILLSIPSRHRPRLKAHGSQILCLPCLPMFSSRQALPPHQHRDPADILSDIVVERTFVCSAPRLLPATTVAQSTTEAINEDSTMHYAYRRGLNPRRCMSMVYDAVCAELHPN